MIAPAGPATMLPATAPVTAPAACLVSGTFELGFDFFAMKAVYMRDRAVERQRGSEQVPRDELGDRVVVGTLATGGRQAVQDGRFGPLKVWQPKTRFSGGFALVFIGIWASAPASRPSPASLTEDSAPAPRRAGRGRHGHDDRSFHHGAQLVEARAGSPSLT
jgi:hypothetical protein